MTSPSARPAAPTPRAPAGDAASPGSGRGTGTSEIRTARSPGSWRRPVDRRGLTAAAGAVLLLAATGVAAALDLPDDVGLHAVFLACFAAACAVVALAVHREDLRAAVVMPPLCFAVAVCVVGAARGGEHSGALAGRVALGLAQPLVFGAPALLTGTAVALVVALLRALAGRRR